MKGVALPLAITLAVQALTSMAMIAPTVMAPVAAAALGVSAQGIGWFVALEYFFAMLSGLACGALIARFGPVRVCQICVCLAAAGLAAGTGALLPVVFAAAGLIYSSAHVAGIVGRIAWGAVADRWLSPRSMLGLLGVMMALSGMGAASISAAWPLPVVIAVSVLFGASAVGWNGVYLAEVARRPPPGRVGAVTGGTQFFTFIGALAAPPLFGFVVGPAGSYGKAYLVFCVLPALTGLRLLLSARRA